MFKATHFTSFFFFFILMILCGQAHCRLITTDQSSADLVFDGVHHPLALLGREAESSTCEESYGFLPCTTSVLGNLFLIMVYGYLMFLAATYLSSGSELLLEILSPGLVGGLFLPMLGSLPDAILILATHLSLLHACKPTEAEHNFSLSMITVFVNIFAGFMLPEIFSSTKTPSSKAERMK